MLLLVVALFLSAVMEYEIVPTVAPRFPIKTSAFPRNFLPAHGFHLPMLKRFNSSQWTPSCAAHLLNRAGFGGSPAEVQALYALGLNRAVEAMLSGSEDDDLFPPPTLTPPKELFEEMRAARSMATEEQKREAQQMARRQQAEQMRATRAWWLDRMRYTSYPLREKMTLFWHGHFATGVDKVRAAYLMWQQNETFRARALGSFRSLAKEVSRDPAMMRYLDLQQSNREKPNENFARELMELFLLGEGVRYTEKDIKESARAFTGYRIDQQSGGFVFQKRQFDPTDKTFMGRTGPHDGDAIIDIILDQPESSAFIGRKLWVFFAAENPSPAIVQNVAGQLRGSNYDVKATLREIFLSEEFYSPKVVRSQIKSPVQWIIQTSRVLEAPLPSQAALETSMSQLGQVLFAPPNVKGWEGGRAWISSSTLLFRYNLAGYIVSGKAPALDGFRRGAGSVEIPLAKIAPPELRKNPEALCDAVSQRLLNAKLEESERKRIIAYLREHGEKIDDPALRDFLYLMMSTPDFQLS